MQHSAARATHARTQTTRKPRARKANAAAAQDRYAPRAAQSHHDAGEPKARKTGSYQQSRKTTSDPRARNSQDRFPRKGAASQQDRPARKTAPVARVQEAPAPEETYSAPIRMVAFEELGLPTPLLKALRAEGITTPFPIQSATLPDALAGRDVLGRAQTGSGKTLAFGLALLTRLDGGKARPLRPRALVLVPTRELAIQVSEALIPLAKSLNLWCRTVVGGMSFPGQVESLRRGVDLLIATPGRLSDHVRQGTCDLSDVLFTAVDEADQMADMGFLPQVRAILDLTPPDGQRMLFSATLDKDVDKIIREYLTDPVTHSVSPTTASVTTMEHHVLLVSRADKPTVIAEMAAREGRTIMFVRTKHHVDRLTGKLRSLGVRAGALHGGKTQGARNRVLGEFRDGEIPVLVATDVAARGIHVDGISLVVHVDPPADAKDYLHRAGRTARAGESGTVVVVATHDEQRSVLRLTEQAGVNPQRTKVHPGHADLARITGARQPTGEPVVERERKPAPRPKRDPHTQPARGSRFSARRGAAGGRRPNRSRVA